MQGTTVGAGELMTSAEISRSHEWSDQRVDAIEGNEVIVGKRWRQKDKGYAQRVALALLLL